MGKTDVKEDEYWERWIQSHDSEAADRLLQLYMPLVNYHVQRIGMGLPRNIDRSELYSNGLFGLYDALEKFDRQRDLKFDTYASFRIRGAILDGLRKEDWMPRSVRERSKKIEKIAESIEQKKMGTATIEEVAQRSGLSAEEVSQTLSAGLMANLVSLDDTNQTVGGEMAACAIVDSASPLPEEHLIEQENKIHLAQEIEKLSEKERLVVTLFYYEGLTLTEIGSILDLSTSRISQIHSKSIFKLRRYLKAPESR